MKTMTTNNVWVILVAGEHHEVTLGAHSSITNIGIAYNLFRTFIPRERIIVIAQVNECRNWHEKDLNEKIIGIIDSTRILRQQEMWEERKNIFWKYLGNMIEEGGADYDGEDVNPDTLLNVLRGEKSLNYPKVVEYEKSNEKARIFLSMNGHGNWNVDDDNHYFYFPHPSPTFLRFLSNNRPISTNDCNLVDNTNNQPTLSYINISEDPPSEIPTTAVYLNGIEESFYNIINNYLPLNSDYNLEQISNDNLDVENSYNFYKSKRKPFKVFLSKSKEGKPKKTIDQLNTQDASILHWQLLFDALKDIFTSNRHSQPASMVIFHHSCGSGGMYSWLKENKAYEEYYGCNRWPIFVMYTAEPGTSAVGTVWNIFYNYFSIFINQYAEISDRKITMNNLDKIGVKSFDEFYKQVMEKYYKQEETIYNINFSLTQEERSLQGYQRFGVLDTAYGKSSEISNCTLDSFFSSDTVIL